LSEREDGAMYVSIYIGVKKWDNDIPTKFSDKVLTQLTWQQFF